MALYMYMSVYLQNSFVTRTSTTCSLVLGLFLWKTRRTWYIRIFTRDSHRKIAKGGQSMPEDIFGGEGGMGIVSSNQFWRVKIPKGGHKVPMVSTCTCNWEHFNLRYPHTNDSQKCQLLLCSIFTTYCIEMAASEEVGWKQYTQWPKWLQEGNGVVVYLNVYIVTFFGLTLLSSFYYDH